MPVDDPSPSETPAEHNSRHRAGYPGAHDHRRLSAQLRVQGFEGATADDVVTVLGTQQKIDVVFTEVQLSGSMDGFGLAQWVREKHPGVDVILTSGIAKAAEQAADLCDEGPLEKPYHPQEVVRRINILLERRRTAPAGVKDRIVGVGTTVPEACSSIMGVWGAMSTAMASHEEATRQPAVLVVEGRDF